MVMVMVMHRPGSTVDDQASSHISERERVRSESVDASVDGDRLTGPRVDASVDASVDARRMTRQVDGTSTSSSRRADATAWATVPTLVRTRRIHKYTVI